MLLLWYVVMFMFNNNFPGSNVFVVVRSDIRVILSVCLMFVWRCSVMFVMSYIFLGIMFATVVRLAKLAAKKQVPGFIKLLRPLTLGGGGSSL